MSYKRKLCGAQRASCGESAQVYWEVHWEVRSSPRDVHLLLLLLLVLFFEAHLHCHTYAVHMNNSNLPLVYLAGNCA